MSSSLFRCCCLVAESCPTVLRPHGLQPTRPLCPWDSLGKNTGAGCHSLLQGIFSNQGSDFRLHALQADSLSCESPGNPLPLVEATGKSLPVGTSVRSNANMPPGAEATGWRGPELRAWVLGVCGQEVGLPPRPARVLLACPRRLGSLWPISLWTAGPADALISEPAGSPGCLCIPARCEAGLGLSAVEPPEGHPMEPRGWRAHRLDSKSPGLLLLTVDSGWRAGRWARGRWAGVCVGCGGRLGTGPAHRGGQREEGGGAHGSRTRGGQPWHRAQAQGRKVTGTPGACSGGASARSVRASSPREDGLTAKRTRPAAGPAERDGLLVPGGLSWASGPLHSWAAAGEGSLL